ncbi:hypothetical protein [Rothia sp. ZJ932]|uniref:hypothetical protein n=1 Tax=Rothia sp. ZJ932 TaxID=2810516 RepID=UPI00196758D2|nr:hypothetical protein [Rothia sp. ZJ932]QRZ61574.1 hypothetical protein JR346_10265 [Rothia sp. ZJ932]
MYPRYEDFDDFRSEPLIRARFRAYQIACWQGYLGTHEFFLGHSLRGWGILLFTSVLSTLSFSNR